MVKESCGDAEIAILRQNGADGAVAVHWRTIDKTAINGKDYQGGEGLVEFNHGEVSDSFDPFLLISGACLSCSAPALSHEL